MPELPQYITEYQLLIGRKNKLNELVDSFAEIDQEEWKMSFLLGLFKLLSGTQVHFVGQVASFFSCC